MRPVKSIQVCGRQRYRFLLLAALLLSLEWVAPTLSFAAEAKLSHLGHLMADEAAGENAPELKLDFWQNVAFEGLPIEAEKTRLEDIQKRFGGSLHAHDAAAGTVTWLCFAKRAAATARAWTVWFASSTAGSEPHGHPVTLIAVQEINAGASDGCAATPSGSSLPTFDVPSLGSRAVNLKAHFGQLPYDRVGNVYYDSVRPLDDGSDKSVYQRLGYIVTKRGMVTGVAVTQTTN